ncbi:MAG: Tad domain-containing protein [Rhodobacteraceae bacterium]|nr:Tad domain-containing protein [Paracoccaceae bacterium]
MIQNVMRNSDVRPVRARLRAFRHDESGVMAPLVLILFVLMILVGGIAVDVARYETRRVEIQNTLDRATLAAASMTQALAPVTVVNDWFTKADLNTELGAVTVTTGMNFKNVRAEADVTSKNYFMSMLEIDYLQGVDSSQAEQRVTNVEIALVLDVSGSMYNQISRITNLKTAAKDFIDTVLDSDTENKISIAIVPYNGQVNLGPTLAAKFNVSYPHSYPNSYCIDLPTSTFANTTLSRTTAFPQAPFDDGWSSTTQSTSYTAPISNYYDSSRRLYSNVWCNPVAGNYVRPFNNNHTTLKSQIDGLVAIGATSIDLGMKWGTFLLDPSSRSINAELAGSRLIPAYFGNRPADYNDDETLKVIVLMTDGENFVQERFGDAYRTGTSPIWLANDGRYSIFHDTRVDSRTTSTICNSRPFWVPHLGAWHSRPWTGSSPSSSACYVPATTSYSNTTRQNWQAVWAAVRVQWVAWELYARALGTSSSTRTSTFNTWLGNFRTLTDTDVMDSRLDDVCSAAKNNGVLVYGIAFEAPDAGASAIRSCVSVPKSNYFFDVSVLEIDSAFDAIASNLSQLRLTQ